MSNFICSECGMNNIDCGRDGYKTPREIELEKHLEVSEKEHYRTLERLRIATKALNKCQEAINRFKKDPMNNIIMLAHQLIYDIDIDSKKAIKEMKGVK